MKFMIENNTTQYSLFLFREKIKIISQYTNFKK